MSIESIRHASFAITANELAGGMTDILADIELERKDIHEVYGALEVLRDEANSHLSQSYDLDSELEELVDVVESTEGLAFALFDIIRDMEWFDPDSPHAQALRRAVGQFGSFDPLSAI